MLETIKAARGIMLAPLLMLLMAVTHADGRDTRTDLLDMRAGAVVLSHPGNWDKQWPAMGIIDGTTKVGWASAKRKPLPHHFTIELSQTFRIDTLAVDNSNSDENDFPLISARDVVFYGSNTSPNGGFELIGRITVAKGGRTVKKVAKPQDVRWLRVTIESNYGNPRFTELMELEAYGEPVGPAPVQPDPSGDYVTNWEMLKIDLDGQRLTGCYDLDAGFVLGKSDGRVLDFHWVEHGGEEFGEALMVMASNGNFVNGLWYEQGELKGIWYGNRELGGEGAACDIEQSGAKLGHVLKDKAPR
ncbi:MAG: hypothetical protein ACWA5Q_01120 [bacterium]